MEIEYILLEYPACNTSKKTMKWLKEHNVPFVSRNIKEEQPTQSELEHWVALSALPIKSFFNTSGKSYRENNMKEIVPKNNYDELIGFLASDGMMVKRPILIAPNFVLVGFDENEWRLKLGLSKKI